MTIGEFFNKKSRRILASLALAFGVAGGYAGSQIAMDNTGAQPSTYTIAQLVEAGEKQEAAQQKFSADLDQMYFPQRLPSEITVSQDSIAAQARAVAGFESRIAQMQAAKQGGADVTAAAVSFVNDLRLSEDLSERDYAKIVRDYNKRVGVDVTAETGNWQQGIMYQQEANAAVHFIEAFSGGFFGSDDDEDSTPQEMSRDIGAAMVEGQKLYDAAAPERAAAGLKGGAAGGLLGGLLLVPALIRARRNHPKVPEAPKA